jgi:hypothetical protein
MKPTIDDIKNHFKPNDLIKNPNSNLTCLFSNIDLIWDNGTGGWSGFIKGGGVIILYSGFTNKYSDIL